MKTLALGAMFQRRSVRCGNFYPRQRGHPFAPFRGLVSLKRDSPRLAPWAIIFRPSGWGRGQVLSAFGLGKYKVFHFRPFRRDVDAYCKHTYTGGEPLR